MWQCSSCRLKHSLNRLLFHFFMVGLYFCCFNFLNYLPKCQPTAGASTREEMWVSGGAVNEFVSSAEPLELSGPVQGHNRTPLGLTRPNTGVTHPHTIALDPGELMSSSRWQCLFCGAKPLLPLCKSGNCMYLECKNVKNLLMGATCDLKVGALLVCFCS